MNKTLVFDMDNTLNKFYDVNGWLDDLHAENIRPYVVAEPKYSKAIINTLLSLLKDYGWRIVITTWLAKDSTKEYDNKVRVAKKEWLDKYEFPYDELHMIKYGVTKANATRHLGGYQILFDDNEQIRKGWTLGDTVDANKNIIDTLIKLVEVELS